MAVVHVYSSLYTWRIRAAHRNEAYAAAPHVLYVHLLELGARDPVHLKAVLLYSFGTHFGALPPLAPFISYACFTVVITVLRIPFFCAVVPALVAPFA